MSEHSQGFELGKWSSEGERNDPEIMMGMARKALEGHDYREVVVLVDKAMDKCKEPDALVWHALAKKMYDLGVEAIGDGQMKIEYDGVVPDDEVWEWVFNDKE